MAKPKRSKITLKQLEYLCAVAEAGSLSVAAQNLGLSAVTVGQALKDLEGELGVRLVDRAPARGAQLTTAGQRIKQRAEGILNEAARLPMLADAARDILPERLRIGTFPTLSAWAIPPIVERLDREHPGVDVHIVEGDMGQLREELRKGRLDVAIGFATHVPGLALSELEIPGVPCYGGVEIYPLRRVGIKVLMSQAHPLASKKTLSFGDLAEERIALLAVTPVDRLLKELLSRHGLDQNIRWRSPNVESIRNLVGRGMCISLLMSPTILGRTTEGHELKATAIEGDPLPNYIVIASPQGMGEGPILKIVTAALGDVPPTTTMF